MAAAGGVLVTVQVRVAAFLRRARPSAVAVAAPAGIDPLHGLGTGFAGLAVHCRAADDVLAAFAAAFTRLLPGGELLLVDHAPCAPAQGNGFTRHSVAGYAGFTACGELERIDGAELTRWQREPAVRWRAAPLGEQDLDALASLFTRAFDVPFDAGLWQWKYGQGRGYNVGVWAQDRLIAHYGIERRDTLLAGERLAGCHVGDVMVDPQVRGVLTRRGPFQRAAAALIESQVGQGRPLQFGVGFPNARAARLGVRLGLYAPVGEVIELRWPARPWHGAGAGPVRRLDLRRAADAALAQQAWARLAADLPRAAIDVRDVGYLQRRYDRHPRHTYRLLAIGRDRPGVVAVRLHRRSVEILDVLGALAELPGLLQAAAGYGARRARRGAFLWASRQHAAQLALPQARQIELGIVTVANAWSRGVPPAALEHRWWLTGGDTDFR
ncbi:MAG TPA: GNAT family N-acetyltransferase [Gammaproteobacteria bacterium]|nr:GNAT family N-acetyltransferase [Gammaproteobacteria bacterium]